MPKIPRDLSGRDLATLLSKYGYEITRQSGSHIRLTSTYGNVKHHITIPDHSPLKIGTLGNILRDLAQGLNRDRESLIAELFKDY
ncbi:MAG: type II toxin-antitoxin system HicA family toxin [Nitrospirae bacterium]|nr:type II toxin-antitoxin system HicA family toxin [Nitrospirota bacterium]MBF0536481.1 type II toxin-antitoxin system HicA family toxin [Nitrospirota bacterium]MBF0617849.1 type II toxin-antitoxin system HicA family toxin [Nitrospirota bacterium]